MQIKGRRTKYRRLRIKSKRDKTTNCLLEWKVPVFYFGVLGHTVWGEYPFLGLLSLHFVWVLLDQVKEGKKEEKEKKEMKARLKSIKIIKVRKLS